MYADIIYLDALILYMVYYGSDASLYCENKGGTSLYQRFVADSFRV